MEHNQNSFATEASTDERASSLNPSAAAPDEEWPEFASRAEAEAYWKGVTRGIRAAGREPGHPHLPADFELNLARPGHAPGLTSDKKLDVWPYDPADDSSLGATSHGAVEQIVRRDGRAERVDGLNLAAEQHFLRVLAETGVVADACRAVGLSRQAVYARRNSAAGRPFALAWEAALLLSRQAIADDVLGRARHGVIERVYRNGELVAERHRYDNRLTMAVLTRLDRLAEGGGANAPAVGAVAREFDQFLTLLHDPGGAADFIAARTEASSPDEEAEAGSEPELLDRLERFRDFGAGLPEEIDTSDLDPAEMEGWSDADFARAKESGLLKHLAVSDWPEAARKAPADGADGMCKARQLFLQHHPRAAVAEPEAAKRIREEEEEEFAGCAVWEDPQAGWITDFPPPPGFSGWDNGEEPGEYGYERSLAPEERFLVDEFEEEAAQQRQAILAEQEEARRRFFSLGGPGAEEEERAEMHEDES